MYNILAWRVADDGDLRTQLKYWAIVAVRVAFLSMLRRKKE